MPDIPEVSARNGIRVYHENTPEVELFRFGSIMVPAAGQRINYTDGGSPIMYKVELIVFEVNEEPYTSHVKAYVSTVV